MPQYSSYPPVSSIPGMGGGGSTQQAPAANGAQMLASPIINALKVLGISIQGAQQAGNPNAPAMGQAFSGLLQSMAAPSLQRGAQMQGPAPQQPPAPAPQAAPAAPAPQAAPPVTPAPQPAPAPMGQPPMGQRGMNQQANLRPFGQTPGQRPVSKQPVIL